MKKQTFWADASRYGAIIGGVEILFLIFEAWMRGNGLLSLLKIVAFVTLIYLFTKRRATLYGQEEGYSYGNGLRFILWASVFAGIVSGAYEIIARNWLFPAFYHEQLNQALVAYSQIGLKSAQLAEIKNMTEQMMFSPIFVVLGSILNTALSGLFFGLFVAAFTKRDVDIFTQE